MTDSTDELAALARILNLSKHELQNLAVEMRITKTWCISDGEPKPTEEATDEHDRLLLAIIVQTFNLKELVHLAKSVGIKQDGVGWGSRGTPNKTKADIAVGLLGKRTDVCATACGPELADTPQISDFGAIHHVGSDVADDVVDLVAIVCEDAKKLRDAMQRDSRDALAKAVESAQTSMEKLLILGKSRLQALADLDVNSGLGGKVARQMWEDFTLTDLVYLAKERGIKKDGINWGRDGTPHKTKKDIIAALVRQEKASPEKSWASDYRDIQIDTGHWLNFFIEEGPDVPIEFMDRQKYRAHLQRTVGLHSDQDVFHIIASANGGPDHPDNYLGALSGIFNRSIGDKMDYFCCFIAGLEKTEKAIEKAIEAERLYRSDSKVFSKVIDRRHHERPTLFSENAYNRDLGRCVTAAEMVERGRSCWATMRLAAIE